MASARPLVHVLVREQYPWTVFRYDENNRLDVVGAMGDILKILAKNIKFDYKFVFPSDNFLGYQFKNGSWAGLIGSIERGEAEFSLHPFTVTLERERVIDFTTPITQNSVSILTPRPMIEYDIQGVFKPFPLEVWLLTLISLVVISAALVLTEKVESKLYGYKIPDLTANSLMWSTKALTQEGSLWLPSADGGRLIVTTWLLASLIFMSCYSGILTAMLTVPKVAIPVDSLEDLVFQNKIPWKMLPGTSMMQFLQQSNSTVHQKAYTGLAGTIKTVWGAREDIVRGEFAVISDEATLKMLMDWDYSTNGRCNLYLAREPAYSKIFNAMAFRTGSVYLEKTNRIIAALRESGIINLWISQLTMNATQCLKSPSYDRAAGTILALNLQAFWGSFIILLAGFFMASTVFLLEILL